MGPASGASPDSFRAEAYGMLATVCFLNRLAEFTGYHDMWDGILATDSQSLLDTLLDYTGHGEPGRPSTQNAQKRKTKRELDVEGPEWDIISSILEALEAQPRLSLQYVRGHQDRRTEYTNLSLMAQLNVDADEMATVYQTNYGMPRPVALLTNTAAVHLVTPQGSVTSKHGVALRFPATYGPLMTHIQVRNGWSSRETQTINWTAHASSLKKRIHHRTHYIKLVHGILPTCKQLYRKDPIRSLCPACKTAVEDWSHILVCAMSSRQSWRNDTLDAIEVKCRIMSTRPLLRRVLLAGIGGWFQESDSFSLAVDAFPSEVHRLIRHQNAIGWGQIFLGRFCLEWSDLQDGYYHTRQEAVAKPSKALTGQRWQIHIIGEIWDQWKLLWHLRNQELHGTTLQQQASTAHREVQRDLRDIYDNKALMEPSVQDLLYPDVTDHLNRPTWFNKNWLAIHAPLAKASIKRARDRAIGGVRSIRQYFSSAR
jgi:hypothetical protein